MASRVTKTMRGLLIPASRTVNTDSLAVNTNATSTSNYSQGTSRPGAAATTDAFARLVPQLSGEQGTAQAKVRVMSSGNPGRDPQDCHVVIRTDATTETDSDYRGWNEPALLHGWSTLTWGAGGGSAQAFDVACIPSTQKPIAVYADTSFSSSTTNVDSRTWDWTTTPPDWAAEVSITLEASAVVSAISVLVLPETERVLMWHWIETTRRVDAYYSDDDGATWAVYALQCTPDDDAFGATSANDADRMRTAYHRGDIVMFLEEEGATGDLTQYASNSLGTRFTKVEARSALGHQVSTFALPDGSGIGIVYRDQSANTPQFLKISSAYQASSEATAVQISALAMQSLTAWVDYDGRIYVVGWGPGSTASGAVLGWYSNDNGDTWTAYSQAAADDNMIYFSGDSATTIKPAAACAARGSAVVLCDWAANPGSNDDDIGGAWLGGWSNLVASHGLVTAGGKLISQSQMMGWGWDTSTKGATWLPIELPSDQANWASLGTAGTLGATGMTITTSAATGNYAFVGMTTPDLEMSCMFEMEVLSDTDASQSSNRIGFRLILADGVDDELEIIVRIDDAGFQVYDNIATANIGTAVAITGMFQVAIWMDTIGSGASGSVNLWYRTAHDSEWTEHLSAVSVSNSGGVNSSEIGFGHLSSGTNSSLWRQVHYRAHDTANASRARWEAAGTDNCGKAIGALPYPIPDIGTTTGDAFLSVRSGPGRVGDVFTIDPTYDHPLENLFPAISPSPKETWKSSATSGTAEQRWVFDLTRDTSLGSYTLGLYIGGANFRTAVLEGWNGSSWVTLGTYDGATGFTSMTYVLNGDIISPNTSSGSNGGRFIQANEFKDGHIVIDAGATEDHRTIAQHTGGIWTPNDTVLPQFRMSGIDGTEVTSGTCHIVAPQGLLIVHLDDLTIYDKYQVRVPGGDTPSGVFECGVMLLGYLGVFGRGHSRGWSQRLVPNIDQSTVQGTIRTREITEPVEEWSWSWVEGVDLQELRKSSDVNFYGSSAANKAALTADQDVLWALKGMMRDSKSGEYPVVAVANISVTSGTTVTDPSLILYGSLTSPIQGTHVVGDETSGEVYRVEPITIRGIK